MNDPGFGGNRWPRQETLALLKIRSDMDIAFRDASVEGPLWEEVSRKMRELGYIRNAKKCKEKFENVYKYHKRTKEGRIGKSEGKTYRFFDQLEALDTTHHQQKQPLQPQTQPPPRPETIIPQTTNITTTPSFPNISGDFLSDNSTSSSSSYSTSSDVETSGSGGGKNKKKRKRKWTEFFVRQVVDKQEELEQQFLEAVEKREHERMVREESWRSQEIAPVNRERDISAQERSMSAAKDAAGMAQSRKRSSSNRNSFLQKFSDKPQQPQPQTQVNNNNNQQQMSQTPQPPLGVIQTLDIPKMDNGDKNMTTPASASTVSSSRWPKVEIEALIKLWTNLDSKYLENGPKGALWEEISAGMRRLGFNRNSKRCKDKWEKINKYFKKVKESSKKSPQDSKTCPYFNQLDALYRERNSNNNNMAFSSSTKPDNLVPLMVQPEQQWPPPATVAQPDHHPPPSAASSQPLDEEEDEENEEERDHPREDIDSTVYRLGKHHPPCPESEVWRLEGITKDGVEASLLGERDIHTVKDVRRRIAMDPDALHQILGRFVSKQTLETIVSHAMHCVLDGEDEFYAYDVKAQGVFLLFNSVYDLVQVSFDGVTSLKSHQLTSSQKELIDNLKPEAYQNVDRFVRLYRVDSYDSNTLWYSKAPDFSASQSDDSDTNEACPPHLSSSDDSDTNEVCPIDPSRISFDKYDVVIRYSKSLTSNRFISHLNAALCQKGVSAAGSFLSKPVDRVPVCSVMITFLDHGWDSYNLLEFSERLLKKELEVSQIFYSLSLYGEMMKLERLSLQCQEIMWWNVLQNVALKPDYEVIAKSEPELMPVILRDVSTVLYAKYKEKMIGMDTQVGEILFLLRIESLGVRGIGIWGTAGIGKTAIAENIFRRISAQYRTCVFLKNFHEQVKEKGQVTMREEFLSKILEVEAPQLRVFHINKSFLRSRLQCKKVLVVLDDVNDFKDIETFSGNLKYLGPGSRIIITSRNRRVFVQSEMDHIYEVKPLNISMSLRFLDDGTLESHTSTSSANYWKQSLELIRFANGNPEVLQYMKSRLHKDSDQLSQEVLQTSPICIPRILRSCYGLDENEMNIFLDIACFFRKMDRDDVAMLLDGCGFFAHVGLRNLVDKSLLTISHNSLNMHRFIQATGREIVRQESANEPGKRTRLWNAEEIMDVFLNDSGTSAIEGIFLDMPRRKFDADPNIFEKMRNLRLLKFYCYKGISNVGVSLSSGLEYLPSKLRLLHWEYYPLSSLPQSFDPRNLVELNLSNSCVKKLWKGKKSLEKLKKMRLSNSHQLTKIPRLSTAPNLELLDLEGCNSLVSISKSICYLTKLVSLNLKDCSKLESIPSTVDLESLDVLNISGCSKLMNFPEISPNVKQLYMGGTTVQEIPPSIKNLVLLEILDLENSKHLANLPTNICKLKHLETLNLSGCSSLERFPGLSRKMKCLKCLDLSRTAVKELPSSVSYLTALEELRLIECRNLASLPDDVWRLRLIKVEFRQIDTEKFSRLWNRQGWLKKVKIS